MDRKMLNLARAKKKLRYFRAEEKTPCALKDVYSLHDLDNIFDDLDSPSESGTPLLSPSPKSAGLVEQVSTSHSPEMKPPSPFGAEEPEVLAPESDIQDDHLNDKESPFKVIAPIKTSSPINMAVVGSGARNPEQPDPSPLAFRGEEKEPVEGDLRLPPFNQLLMSPNKLLQGDSDVLESPPARLDFGKPSNLDIVSVPSSTPLQSSTLQDREYQTTAPEKGEELQADRSPSLPPAEVLQGSHSDPLPQEQCKDQGQEVKVDAEVKKWSFQQQLKNALQPKASCFRKPESQKRPVRAPSPIELDDYDDFMILEDDTPILFTIPRKSESSQKGKMAPEVRKSNPTKVSEVKQAALKPTDEAKSCKDEPRAPKLPTLKKGGKTCSKNTGTVAQEALAESVESLGANEEVAVCEQISCPSPQATQDADLPNTGKQRTRSKANPDQVGSKDGKKDVQVKSPGQKPSRKKSAKLTSDTSTRKEPETNVKKKNTTARSTIKISGPLSTSLVTAKLMKHGKNRSTVQTETLSKDKEQEDKLHDHNESVLNTREPQQRKSTIEADKKASKQPTTKQAASERLTKVTKVKTKEDLKRTQCTVPECDFSTEGPATGRRKRKPPGEWWLAPQSESLTREQEEVVHQSLQLKSHKKVKRKEIPSRPADSAKDPFPRTVRDSPTGPQNTVAGGKVAKKGKKPHADELKSNSAGHQKNPKRAHGKRKPKMVTANQCAAPAKMISMTPAPVVGEEVEGCAALEQLSSVAGSTPFRQPSLTPGRMFDQIYTRDNQSGAAQKCRQSPLHGPETVPGKRQRKAPGTWWEVLPSQTSPDSSCPPLNCSLSKPIPQKDHRRGTSVVSSQKMPVRAQKTNKRSMINTPKSVRRSLATFNSILASAKAEASIVRGLRRKGCRNLLHSLEEQSEHSSEIVHSDGPQNASGNATYDVCVSAVTMEPVTGRKKMDARLSAGSRVSDHDIGFKSGPSSMIELERFEEEEDSDLPSSQIIRHLRHVPRVLADCDLCGPPLRPIVLEPEDWDNLCVWLSHLWPSSSKNGRVISPDDFHWHAYGGRGMGHTVDLQNNTFSNGKILLGSFMKKPPQVDLNAVTHLNQNSITRHFLELIFPILSHSFWKPSTTKEPLQMPPTNSVLTLVFGSCWLLPLLCCYLVFLTFASVFRL
ncbi:uncharacterized protein si:ch211-161h7.4 isoform X1 [Electrophorus electricus]|uniref:uncharacterized protein si:ch211-161h7.4 isoform X1 n=1 Tax=Electrophorus electricus TaxID=8005 RepID=UPI0015D0B9DA|nr:uncharacterized protein si:ch211-161h7.4 isoform X1 [Electrophorus electricus]